MHGNTSLACECIAWSHIHVNFMHVGSVPTKQHDRIIYLMYMCTIHKGHIIYLMYTCTIHNGYNV